MMAAQLPRRGLIDQMPKVRGRLTQDAPLGGITWFGVGGAAEIMFRPADEQDLADFIAQKPPNIPVTVIGVGSNLLVRDGGVAGIVIRLGRYFAGARVEGNRLNVGAAVLDYNVAKIAADSGLSGMEFLSGVPGTIGGALRMNAGAYGQDMGQIVVAARAIDEVGIARDVSKEELGFGYRSCGLPADWVFTSAILEGIPDVPSDIHARIADIKMMREGGQPVRARTGGSTFKNPTGYKAWELIDRSGCRGLTVGGAQVSEKHCNFIINTGGATAADIEMLGEEIIRRVYESTGIYLEWEIKRVGRHAASGEK